MDPASKSLDVEHRCHWPPSGPTAFVKKTIDRWTSKNSYTADAFQMQPIDAFCIPVNKGSTQLEKSEEFWDINPEPTKLDVGVIPFFDIGYLPFSVRTPYTYMEPSAVDLKLLSVNPCYNPFLEADWMNTLARGYARVELIYKAKIDVQGGGYSTNLYI